MDAVREAALAAAPTVITEIAVVVIFHDDDEGWGGCGQQDSRATANTGAGYP